MAEPSKETKDNIKTAAQMRAEGKTWAEIAPAIGRATEGSARQLPFEHPALWAIEYQQACAHYLVEDSVEARLTQRELLAPTLDAYDKHGNLMKNADGSPMQMPNDPSIRQRAAHSILSQTAKLRKQQLEISGREGAPWEISVKKPREWLTDEELEDRIRACEREQEATEATGGGET